MRTLRHGRPRSTDERGAALVEFALIFPIFMMLILGMFSGGQAYNRKLTLTAAARETSRYGATLPVTPGCGGSGTNLNQWLNCVAQVAVQTSTEELAVGATGRSICVAYVNGTGTSTGANDVTTRLVLTTSNTGTPAAGACAGAPAPSTTQRQVQVVLQRTSKIQALFFSYPVRLRGVSVTRFER